MNLFDYILLGLLAIVIIIVLLGWWFLRSTDETHMR